MTLAARWAALTIILLAAGVARNARADDGIFPPAQAAKASIDFDGRGFLIHGRREFLASGTLHYPRVPRQLWRDRLLRIKSAGFNCIETYAFWNLHEPREGKWDFSGDKDLDAFLKQVKELGMYAIVRVGPYVCAEWDSGGYPVWLRFKPGVRVREHNAPFEAAVDRWFERVMPIVTANQIHRGGAVIMVQLENEHPQGWGREMPNDYFRHLRDKALALGMEVPYFFSGLHHGSDPAGDRPWDSKGRTNPWFTTEFWPGWYDLYGPLSESRYRGFVRGTWKILAYGGNGYNFYMLHGGTDFDTWNDDEVASCYDYGAAIGQAGDLRPIYYAFKHAALFARSFPEILENSEDATPEFQQAATHPTLKVTARKSPAGSILFVDNPGSRAIETQVKDTSGALFPSHATFVMPGEIRPFVQDVPIAGNVRLDRCSARILGVARQGEITTLVIFGMPGRTVGVDRADTVPRPEPDAELVLSLPTNETAPLPMPSRMDNGANAAVRIEPSGGARTRVLLSIPIPETPDSDRRQSVTLALAGRKIRVIALSYELAQRTWFVQSAGQTYVVSGPEAVGDLEDKGGTISLQAEATAQRGYSKPVFAEQYGTVVFTPTGTRLELKATEPAARTLFTMRRPGMDSPFDKDFQSEPLAEWEARRADEEAEPGYFAGKWKFSISPLSMGADGDTSAYAWYRVSVRAPKSGPYSLGFSDAGDWITVFVNGAHVASSKVKPRFDKPVPRTMAITLKAGENSLAVFTSHYGRNKLFNYLGPIDTIDAKGLGGPVYLSRDTAGSVTITAWRWRLATQSDAGLTDAPAHTDTATAGWSNARIGDDVFRKQRGFAWYHTTLPSAPGPHRRIHFDGVDDNATVFLNGKRLTYHKGWNDPFDVKLDAAWRERGANELLVLVENGDNTGGIMSEVDLLTNSAQDGIPIQGWRERGGLDSPTSERGWKPYREIGSRGVPSLYRTEFTVSAATPVGSRPILRFSPLGLSRGFVWLNGHNLGRYPDKTRAPGLYLPECWLKQGRNTLVVFDEEGSPPGQAHLAIEPEACRFAYELRSVPATKP